jgi:hypothetical protein
MLIKNILLLNYDALLALLGLSLAPIKPANPPCRLKGCAPADRGLRLNLL